MPYGYVDDQWRAAKDEAIGILSERAAQPVNFLIFYSDLCNEIETIPFEPYSEMFWTFLGEISLEEYRAGRGMLSAIVVRKSGEHTPGPGFLKPAAELGLDVSDPVRVWNEQLGIVHDHWTRAARANA